MASGRGIRDAAGVRAEGESEAEVDDVLPSSNSISWVNGSAISSSTGSFLSKNRLTNELLAPFSRSLLTR